MKKIMVVLFIVHCSLFIAGCATYKFQRGNEPYHKGYVVSRDGYAILEYTVGKDGSVPDLQLAKERFKRRRRMIEYYYKKMGYIENRFKMTFWNPPIYCLKFIGGIFRLPFIALSDYKYEHNLKYRERIRKIEGERELREEARIEKLQEKVDNYIENDLAKEQSVAPIKYVKTGPAVISEKRETTELVPEREKEAFKEIAVPTQVEKEPLEAKPRLEEITATLEEIEKAQRAEEPSRSLTPSALIKAIIIARPTKGYSPLKVRFNGRRSSSPYGKIVSYSWDFGDGDTSTQANPMNIYYSSSFMPQYFTATLTVQDDRGNSAKAVVNIEVKNK